MTTVLGITLIVVFFILLLARKETSEIPSAMTTIGIFGTFLGILWSLYNFNVNDISGSVPQLLEGMKFAFVTSIVGMIFSLGYKYRNIFKARKDEISTPEGISLDEISVQLDKLITNQDKYQHDLVNSLDKNQKDVAHLLTSINTSLISDSETSLSSRMHKIIEVSEKSSHEIDAHLKNIASLVGETSTSEMDQLKRLEKALVGDQEGTLITQMQKLRTTIIDKNDELIAIFKQFTEKMAEESINALIKALTKVMEDFNTRINEQLGENFKNLNLAVEKLVQWQELYRDQVESSIQQLNTATSGVQACETSIKTIAEKSQAILSVGEALSDLILEMNLHTRALEKNLEAFSQLSQSATNAFPIIEKNINALTNEFSDSVKKTTGQIKASVDSQQKNLESMIVVNQESVITHTKALRDNIERLQTEMQQMYNKIGSQIQNMLDQNAQRVSDQISKLDESMGEELDKSLRTLGSQLTSLSKQFVDDYSPLTDKLQSLVNLAKSFELERGGRNS
ncbi:MAG: hypothetical protein NTW14_01785 [bacterium]|nr:hypothetical protein [bacterium]